MDWEDWWKNASKLLPFPADETSIYLTTQIQMFSTASVLLGSRRSFIFNARRTCKAVRDDLVPSKPPDLGSLSLVTPAGDIVAAEDHAADARLH